MGRAGVFGEVGGFAATPPTLLLATAGHRSWESRTSPRGEGGIFSRVVGGGVGGFACFAIAGGGVRGVRRVS